MIKETKYFKLYPETRITFIDKTKNIAWPEWKQWKDCNDKEKEEANLRTIFPNEVILDIEDNNRIEEIKNKLQSDNFKYLLCETGSRGLHAHIFFYNLDNYSKEIRNAIRKKLIKNYACDESKASEDTLIAIINRPHFKTLNKKKVILDMSEDDFNLIPKNLIIELRQEKERIAQLDNKLKDKDFTNYHLKDAFFKYISSNIIPDNTNRDTIIFPNLAIGLVKEGLTEEQIKEIMEPIIKNNFPGKTYSEFNGWVKKALKGDISTYNIFQLNTWVKTYTKENEMYDIKPISINELLTETKKDDPNLERHRFLSDKEFEEQPEQQIKWLVENWIGEGDISFIAGKAASFKTTIATHIAYCVSENKLIFNVYQPTQCKVLYINEENNYKLFKNIVRRVKKGIDLENLKSENLFLSTMENFKIDEIEDIKVIVNFIKQNNIRLVILDSFRRFFIGKENDADVINKIFETLKFIRKECNDITILALHHAKKDGQNGNEDIRDILRGSSDIVNSADSVIGVKRNIKSNKLTIEHIKNRSGEEMKGKVLQIDNEDNKAYIWEVGDVRDKETIKSKPEEFADKILNFLEEHKLTKFTRKDLLPITEGTNPDLITKGLRILKQDGIVNEICSGKYASYTANLSQLVTLESKGQQSLLD